MAQIVSGTPWTQHLVVDPGVVVQHSDLRIFSTEDGKAVEVPAAMMANISPMLHALLKPRFHHEDPSHLVLFTNLAYDELTPVRSFVTTGCIPTDLSQQQMAAFSTFGIDIASLKFKEVAAEKDFIVISKQEATRIEVKIEPDFLEELNDEMKLKFDQEEEEEYDQYDNYEQFQDDYNLNDLDYEEEIDEEPLKPKRKRKTRQKLDRGAEAKRIKTDVVEDDSNYKCYMCDFVASHALIVEQHMLTHRFKDRHFKDDYYYCTTSTCLQEFETMKDWRKHCADFHKDKFFHCIECDIGFARTRPRDQHVWVHHSTEKDKTRYECIQCGAKCKTEDTWKKHQRYENKYHTNQCVHEGCHDTFQSWDEHQAHIEAMHGGKFLHICGICPEVFEDKVAKKQHRFSVHPDAMNSYYKKCDQCGKQTNTLKRHKALDHGMDEPGHCKICKKDVEKRYQHEMTHIKLSESCAICQATGKKKIICRHHKEVEENRTVIPEKQNGPFTCDVCGDTKASLSGLIKHKRHMHRDPSEADSFPCPQCDKTFGSEDGMKSHVTRVHKSMEEKAKFPCPHCPKICLSYMGRYVHISHTHKNPYYCKACGKRFSSIELLKEHKTQGCAEGPTRMATCNVCGKVFTKRRLKQHIINQHMAEDQKPFKCHLCNKGFAKQENLEGHINTHTNRRPFVCQFCGQGFNSRATLSGHEIKTHNRAKMFEEKAL